MHLNVILFYITKLSNKMTFSAAHSNKNSRKKQDFGGYHKILKFSVHGNLVFLISVVKNDPFAAVEWLNQPDYSNTDQSIFTTNVYLIIYFLMKKHFYQIFLNL
jgi:hypothetical protein